MADSELSLGNFDSKLDFDLGLEGENTLDFFQSVPGLKDFFDEDVTLALKAAVERETKNDHREDLSKLPDDETEKLLKNIIGSSPVINNVSKTTPVENIKIEPNNDDQISKNDEVDKLKEKIKELQLQIDGLETEKHIWELERIKKEEYEKQWNGLVKNASKIIGEEISFDKILELVTRNVRDHEISTKDIRSNRESGSGSDDLHIINRLIESRTKLCHCLLQEMGQDEFTQILQGSLDDAENDLQELKRQHAKLKEQVEQQELLLAGKVEKPPEPKRSHASEDLQKMYLGEIDRLRNENDSLKREIEEYVSKESPSEEAVREIETLKSEKMSLEQKLNQLAKFLSTYKREMVEKIKVFRKHSEFLTGWRIDIVNANRISIGLRGDIHDTHRPSLGQIIIGLDSSGTYSVLQSPLTDRFPESVETYLSQKGSIPGLLADILLKTI